MDRIVASHRGVSHASHVTVESQLNSGNTCPYADTQHALNAFNPSFHEADQSPDAPPTPCRVCRRPRPGPNR